MSLASILEQFGALPRYRRLQAIRIACDDALAVWRHYRIDGVPLEYRDSVVGIPHVVDDTLPARALADIDRVLAGESADPAITQAYLEPLSAMQDADLDLPDPIAMAYSAIYNLRRVVIGETTTAPDERSLLSQITASLGALDGNLAATKPDDSKLDGWAAEWWTRVWDAWASASDPIYESHPLVEPAWTALSDGELAAALAAQPDGLAITPGDIAQASLVHAILLSLAGHREPALALAARALGADLSQPNVRRWLDVHLVELVPSAIAVSRDRTRCAVIREATLVVRDLSRGEIAQTTTYPGRVLRLVRFTRDADSLWLAGDRVDAQGVWASFWEGEAHEDHAAQGRGEVMGARSLAALGTGAIVGRHASRVLLMSNAGCELLGELPVVDAAIAEDCSIVVTHDGTRVSIWHRDPPSCMRIVAPAGATPRRIFLGGHDVLVTWSNGTATLHAIAA